MATRSDVGSAPRGGPAPLGRRARAIGSTTGQIALATVKGCYVYRVTGLAAEAAYFAILSLPPLVFALAGAIGYVAQRFDVATITGFREQVLQLAARLLTADAVNQVIAPTLDEVLERRGGRAGGRLSFRDAVQAVHDDRKRR